MVEKIKTNSGFGKQLRLITLDNIYPKLQSTEDRALFSEMLAVKAKGYAPPNYPPTYLTFDVADFVAWHHIFVVDQDQGPEVVAAFKHISLDRCDYYGITPPYYGLLGAPHAIRHAEVLGGLIESRRRNHSNMIFSSGFTMREELRGSSASSLIKEVVAALMYHDSRALGDAPLIGAGVPRFKTERLWEKVGYQRIRDGENELPPFPLKTSENEPIILMKADSFTDWTVECFERHHEMIDHRQIISSAPERLSWAREKDRKAA